VLEDVKWIQDARAQDAIIAGNFSADSLNFAAAMASAEWERARGLASANFDRNWKRWGADHSYTKNSASQVMLAKVRDPTYKLSRAEAAEFVDLFTGTALTVGSSQRGLTFDYAAQEGLLQWIAKGNGKLGDEDATEQAFALVEYLRGASSQAALADGAAKLAATNPQLRTLIEKAQRLNDERTTKWQLASKATDSLQSAGSQKLDDSSQKKVQDEVKETQSRLAAQDAELLAVQRQIESQFPAYQELVNPRIPSVGALAKQLAPGQAYVSLFSGQNGGVVLVVKSDGSRQIAYVPEGREAVEKWVARYRRPFNASSVPERAGAWAGFDPEAAYELYRQWIKPIALALTDADTVLVAPFGALSEIPWGAVLTQSTKNFDSAKWAASQWVVVNSPGASSIMLAQYFRAAHAEKAFLAYADPLFSPQAGPAGSTTRNVRNLLVETTSVVTNAGGFDYTSVPALPDTLDEARAVAMAAGADPDQDTVTGAQATRSRVLASKLDDRRILAFATHGLRAGDLPGVSKPALAMAYEGRGLADSLLTTDDIVGLKLKADWVVLSACNTGRVEGAAGESLSGLSRAFFAAGAKALLATQWAVESSSAKQLVVDTFNAYGSANNVSRGAALAKAQRDMLSGQHGKLFQHPYFWAAYSIIGDPSR
jgi:CHAT domain-containing protein